MANKGWTDTQLKRAVKKNISWSGVCRDVGLVAQGGNIGTVQRHARRLELPTKHMRGQAHGTPPVNRIPLKEILVKDSSYKSHQGLKRRLIREGLLKYLCAECGLSEWRGKPLSLHLDHINGINNDHRLKNLRFLCPNCHSQTPDYCRTHKSRKKSSKKKTKK
jgi:predicted RNA-binding Zn-ribbon protein involved in translation (DUF1610 family)